MARAVERSYGAWVVVQPCRATCTFDLEVVDLEVGPPNLAHIPSIEEMISAVYGSRMILEAQHPLLAR